MNSRLMRWAVSLALFLSFAAGMRLNAQAGFDDDRVMLQGFYWESCRFGNLPGWGSLKWYDIVRQNADAIRDGGFDLVWLPPPFRAGDVSAGYDPREYFNFSNSYGNVAQHRALLEALLERGVEPVADLVFNHRNGSQSWADFKNPDWGPWAICRDDEAFSNPASGIANTPVELRGAPEEHPSYLSGGASTYAYPSFRDIDHTNRGVRRDLIRAMLALQSLGYRGWRYDMVHGFNARWIAVYNRATHPTFSVGEYDWGAHAQQRGWIWNTATDPQPAGADHLRTASNVFDFTGFFTLKDNKGKPRSLAGYGNGIGMAGDTTDGLPWKQRAVTFVENHDTGYRTNLDDTPEKDHVFDSFANNWEVEQAYAYILTHPGVPCVYWKHYFDWGADLRNKISALVNARKVAGVKSGSAIHTQDNAFAAGVYAAMVEGTDGRRLYVRIGGNDDSWNPVNSGYQDFRDYAHGAGWKVWVGIPGNPEVQQAGRRAALPVPDIRDAAGIDVPDSLLDLQ